MPQGAVVIADAPTRRQVGVSGRSPYSQPRRRCLSPAERAAVRTLAGNHPLREVAAEFGVSHETVRKVLHEQAAPVR
jgi:hypothetical protein